jgi:hypothetical protein
VTVDCCPPTLPPTLLSTATTDTSWPSAAAPSARSLDDPLHAAGARPVVLREMKDAHALRNLSHPGRPVNGDPAMASFC